MLQRNILAIDTSTERCSAALIAAGQLSARSSDRPQSHAQSLLPMIDALLQDAKLSLAQLDAIALTLGPGSFTGVRIGLSVVQGLAYGANVPTLGCNSLEVLAQSQVDAASTQAFASDKLLLSCLDARMGEVYWAAYRQSDKGTLVCVSEPKVSKPEDFNHMLSALRVTRGPEVSVHAAGHGVTVEGVDQSLFDSADDSALPHAEHIFALWEDDQVFDVAIEAQRDIPLEPLYLRNEVTWAKRQRIRHGVA
ncbi:MAG: tRNA (adenosine(37)-N6)-threonylcarbamoyltransferase complex dimerization subunit type 1 TsaB [Agarilytica sp.]